MNSKENTITLALPIAGLEQWIQARINEAITEATNSEAQPQKDYVSQKELCQRLSLSAPTVIALRKKGIIQGVQIGNKWRFEVSEVWQSLREYQDQQAKPYAPIKRNGRP